MLFRRKPNDEHRARGYVKQIFALGRETSGSLADLLQTCGVEFPPDDLSAEIALAVLGTSLGLLKGHTLVMQRARGVEIESWCKRSIERDYEFSQEEASGLIEAIDEYQEAVERAMQSGANPFAEISGIMLVRALGPQVRSICVGDTDALNSFVHMAVGDALTLSITGALGYWKGQ